MFKNRRRIFILVLIILGISVPITLAYSISSRYPYSSHIDYEYSFSGKFAEQFELDIVNDALEIPSDYGPYQSVFLKVDLRTNIWGEFFQPYVEISVGEHWTRDYIEHGADGTRYLNLSSLPLAAGEALQLKGTHVEIQDQTAELIVLNNIDLHQSTILVIAPHPDDAEIAAFGLYSSNQDSYIVTVTAGDAGGFTYDERFTDQEAQYKKKGQLRTWNSITVPLLAGIYPEQVLNLGFFDGTLQKLHSISPDSNGALYAGISDIDFFRKQNISSLSEGLKGGSDWGSLVANFEYLLEVIEPDIIVTPYPALDVHSDHKYSTIALIEAVKNMGLREGFFYLYSNHYDANVYYPYGEMGGSISLPPNFDDGIYFRSIYSHHISEVTQNDKLFALEAMHDLRLDTEWLTSFGAIKKTISILKKNALGAEYSFFRKAVRSNELFFVIAVEDIYDDDKLQQILGD